jgi:hypothetical protein
MSPTPPPNDFHGSSHHSTPTHTEPNGTSFAVVPLSSAPHPSTPNTAPSLGIPNTYAQSYAAPHSDKHGPISPNASLAYSTPVSEKPKPEETSEVSHSTSQIGSTQSALSSSAHIPFQIWSPHGTAVPASNETIPVPQSLSVSQSQPKYNVITVAAPPGTVEQESLLVMKDMLKAMADMTRRMLNMEERISRLEMEKEQLSRTVNRLQETQHQAMIRQEAPKPAYPVSVPSTGGYPTGYPPGYNPVTSTYAAVPPGYSAPRR